MLLNKKFLIVALMVPILVLFGIVVKVEYQKRTGKEVELPIHGYDPRDLLSGYYLTYTVDYGVDPCKEKDKRYEAYICLDTKDSLLKEPQDCNLFIHGMCQNGRFQAGIERYYASEHNAQQLQRLIQGQKPMSIVVSVSDSGNAQVKYLVVDGERWLAN